MSDYEKSPLGARPTYIFASDRNLLALPESMSKNE